MFVPKSRYFGLETYVVLDNRGRQVSVVSVPLPLNQTTLGLHLLKQGERLDHLAQNYLDNPAGYWLICELNEVMLAEALTEQRTISIPVRKVR